jgi:hypothetical protein
MMLQELQAQQQLTAAVHHALQMVLPNAASHVASATCSLNQELMTLAAQVTSQQELLQKTLLSATRVPIADEGIEAVAAESAVLSYQIAQCINRMITGLQFQDRNSQWMHNAVTLLQACPTQTTPVEASTVVRLSNIVRARNILASITIGEVREQLVQALEKFRVIPRKSKHAHAASDEDSELF